MDRIRLSDVSLSVANKPKRRIDRGRKGNNPSVVIHSGLTAHYYTGKLKFLPTAWRDSQGPAPTRVPGLLGFLKLGVAL